MHKNSGFKDTFTCSNCPIYPKSNYFMISILNKTKKHLSDSNLLPSLFKKFRGNFVIDQKNISQHNVCHYTLSASKGFCLHCLQYDRKTQTITPCV